MLHDTASSIGHFAPINCNQRVLAAFAVHALRSLARAAGRLDVGRGLTEAETGCSTRRPAEGRLQPVAVQRLPILADAGEHGTSRRVQNEGPHVQEVSGLADAGGADVEAAGDAGRDGAVRGALVAVHDEPRVVRDGLLAQVAAPVGVARGLARDADQAVPLPAVEGQDGGTRRSHFGGYVGSGSHEGLLLGGRRENNRGVRLRLGRVLLLLGDGRENNRGEHLLSTES